MNTCPRCNAKLLTGSDASVRGLICLRHGMVRSLSGEVLQVRGQSPSLQATPVTEAHRTAGRIVQSIEIEFPLPPPELSPNRSVCHQVKANVVRQYRADCLMAIRAALRGEQVSVETPCVLSATFYMARVSAAMGQVYYYPLDVDNAIAAMKRTIDALADGGLIPDDNKRFLTMGPVVLLGKGKHKGRSCIVVRLDTVKG